MRKWLYCCERDDICIAVGFLFVFWIGLHLGEEGDIHAWTLGIWVKGHTRIGTAQREMIQDTHLLLFFIFFGTPPVERIYMY